MHTLRFKTNIKCNNCIQKVSPFLSNIKEIGEWKVDLNTPDRILTVEEAEADSSKIIAAIQQAGYKAELI